LIFRTALTALHSCKHIAVLLAAAMIVALDAAALSIPGAGYVVEYQERDEVQAREVADEAGRALPELKELFGPAPADPVLIILVSSTDRFNESVGSDMPVWTVGAAIGGRNLVVLKSARLTFRRGTSLRRTVRHELTHIVLDANYVMGRLPRWLNEGIAMWQADEPMFRGEFNLAAAALFGRLVPLHDLDRQFRNARNDVAAVCYGESRSLVDFIVAEHGEQAVLRILEQSRSTGADAAFVKALGRTPGELYAEWRRSIRRYVRWYSIVSGIGLFWIMIFLTVAAYLRKRFWGRRKLAEWDEEDPPLDPPF